MRTGRSIVAVLGLAVAALGDLTSTGWAQQTARPTAKRLDEQTVPDLDRRKRMIGAPDPAGRAS